MFIREKLFAMLAKTARLLSAAAFVLAASAGAAGAQNSIIITEDSDIPKKIYGNALTPPFPIPDPIGFSSGVATTGDAAADPQNGKTLIIELLSSVPNLDYTFVGGGYVSGTGHTVNAEGNTVILLSGTVGASAGQGSIVGGVSATSENLPGTTTGNALRNTVTIKDGTVNHDAIGGLSTHGAAVENLAELYNGTIDGTIYGGVASQLGGSGAAERNVAAVHGGAVDYVVGGSTVGGSASNNIVWITRGDIGGYAAGGRTELVNGNANANLVLVEGGTVSGDVVGGYLYNGSASGQAHENIVVLRNAPVISGEVYGGYQTGGGASLILGNTLIFADYSGTGTGTNPALLAIANFQNVHFAPSKQVKSGDVLVRATNLTLGTGADALRASLSLPGGEAPALAAGEYVDLIQSANAITGDVAAAAALETRQGHLLEYTASVAKNGSSVRLTVSGSSLDPRSKALSEGFYAGVGFLTDTFDFVTSEGAESAVLAAWRRAKLSSGYKYSAFGSVHGGTVRHKTGSHVEVKGFSGILGVSGVVEGESFTFVIGAFAEAGKGDYDTFNSFPASANVLGSGDTSYGGGGFLARISFAESPAGSLHMELAGRMGSVKNTFESLDFYGGKVSYSLKSNYYGLHYGIGYLFSVSDGIQLDLYGKYFWTHQNGDSAALPGGDAVRFDSVNSHRLRGGAKLIFNQQGKFQPYVGAAYEHELDGKVSATAYGMKIPEPDASGGTFVGEAGLVFTPSDRFAINVSAQGYTGKRRGITGSIGINILF
jgi:hypothetical protein